MANRFKHSVKCVHEVDFANMDEERLKEIFHLSELKNEWECTTFDDGDGWICYEDVDGDTDDRGYAVYSKATGNLLCLVADSGTALEGYEDPSYGYERSKLYKQIALLAGWPENASDLKRQLTWRELIAKLKGFGDEFLDTDAFVCINKNGDLDVVCDVESWYMTYSGRVPGVVEDNLLYIDLRGNNEE